MEQDDFIFGLLKDKKGLLKYIIDTMMKSNYNTQGLLGMKERGFTTEGMLDNLTKVVAKQQQQIKHLALIALLYAQSDNFDVDVALMMNKFGRGDEALKAMFDKKLKGQ